jgi:ribosome-associated protein
MARKPREDSWPEDADARAPDADGAGPSRTERKDQSHRLRDAGEELVALSADVLGGLSLPELLLDAILDAKQVTSFGARRRQIQFIGKLMRRLDDETLAAVEAALSVKRRQSGRETALLRRAEQWRDSMIAGDSRVDEWLAEHRDTDADRLRGLVRQARNEARPSKPGEAQRHGKAYREIYALVRAVLERR